MNTPEFREYIKQVKTNANVLATDLIGKGHKLVTGGTSNHMLVMNVRDLGLTGSKMERICDAVHITLNKNTIMGDKSAVTPGGVRIGTPAVTTRGYREADMKQVATYIDSCAKLAVEIQAKSGKKLSDFDQALEQDKRV